jgi:hypothetical protein
VLGAGPGRDRDCGDEHVQEEEARHVQCHG